MGVCPMIQNEVNGIQFYTSEEYPLEVLRRCQQRLLDMLFEVQAVLEPQGIKIIASFGTMLGAVRHGGYIPWDDDLDVFIFEEDYQRALKLLRENLGSDIIVQDKLTEPRYWCGWTKLRDSSSEVLCSMWPIDNTLVHRGVCLDLHRLKKSTVKAHNKRICRMKAKANAKGTIKKCRERIKGKESLAKKLRCLLGTAWRVLRYGVKYVIAPVKGSKEYKYYGAEGSVVERTYSPETVLPLKRVKFENTDIWLFADADAALKGDYGDYMSLPKLENRMPHYAKVTFFE